MRVGVDVGGTNTDAVMMDGDEAIKWRKISRRLKNWMKREVFLRSCHVTAAEKYRIIRVMAADGSEFGEMKSLVASD